MTTHDFTFDSSASRRISADPRLRRLRGAGPTDAAADQPVIAVARITSAAPGDGRLDRLAEAVRAGVIAAGGVVIDLTADADTRVPSALGGRARLMAGAILADAIDQALGARRPDGMVCIADGEASLAAAAMVLGRLDLPGLVCGGGGAGDGMALALTIMGLSPMEGQDGERDGRLAVERVCDEDNARKYVTPRSLANAAAAVGGAEWLHLSAIAAEAGLVFRIDRALAPARPEAFGFGGDARTAIRRLAETGAIRNAPTVSGRSLFAEAAAIATEPTAAKVHHLKGMPWRGDDEDSAPAVGPRAIIAAGHARGGDIERPHAPPP